MQRTLLAKRALSRIFRLFASTHRRDIVLLYHSVGESSLWSTPICRFIEQIEWLVKNTEVVSFEEMMQSRNTGNKGIRVSISFDDAYASLYEVAYPVLRDYSIKPIVYINTAYIADDARMPTCEQEGHYPGERFMSWRDIRLLKEEGWIFGSHGMRHSDLTRCTERKRQEELQGSKQEIFSRTGIECDHFSYTWGYYNKSVIKSVQRCGYKTAVTGRFGSIKSESSSYALPRYNVDSYIQLDDFKSMVHGEWDFLVLSQYAAHIRRSWKIV